MAAQGTVASGLQQNTQAPIFNPALPNIENVPALIDTGATMSCIDDQLAQQLGLPLINQVQSPGVHGSAPLNVYLAYLLIPSLSVAQTGEFIGANMAAGGQFHRALLGRTLLQNMLLVYDGRSGSVKLAN
jgi:predicted aspartyl protease